MCIFKGFDVPVCPALAGALPGLYRGFTATLLLLCSALPLLYCIRAVIRPGRAAVSALDAAML